MIFESWQTIPLSEHLFQKHGGYLETVNELPVISILTLFQVYTMLVLCLFLRKKRGPVGIVSHVCLFCLIDLLFQMAILLWLCCSSSACHEIVQNSLFLYHLVLMNGAGILFIHLFLNVLSKHWRHEKTLQFCLPHKATAHQWLIVSNGSANQIAAVC